MDKYDGFDKMVSLNIKEDISLPIFASIVKSKKMCYSKVVMYWPVSTYVWELNVFLGFQILYDSFER